MCKGMTFASADDLRAHRNAVHVVELCDNDPNDQFGLMECFDFGQPCTVCGNSVHALKRGHFMGCENK